MLKKLCLLVGVAATLSIAGSVSRPKDNSFRYVRMTPFARELGIQVAELEVSDKKTVGKAEGKYIYKDDLEKSAVRDALKSTDTSKTSADVLVGANFFYQRTYNDLTVTVVGYPAYYKNIRPKLAAGTGEPGQGSAEPSLVPLGSPAGIETSTEESQGE